MRFYNYAKWLDGLLIDGVAQKLSNYCYWKSGKNCSQQAAFLYWTVSVVAMIAAMYVWYIDGRAVLAASLIMQAFSAQAIHQVGILMGDATRGGKFANPYRHSPIHTLTRLLMLTAVTISVGFSLGELVGAEGNVLPIALITLSSLLFLFGMYASACSSNPPAEKTIKKSELLQAPVS